METNLIRTKSWTIKPAYEKSYSWCGSAMKIREKIFRLSIRPLPGTQFLSQTFFPISHGISQEEKENNISHFFMFSK